MPGLDPSALRAAAGETAALKFRLKSTTEPRDYAEILRVAADIIRRLPPGVPLGNLTAALMLAGTAQMEGALGTAAALIEQDRAPLES